MLHMITIYSDVLIGQEASSGVFVPQTPPQITHTCCTLLVWSWFGLKCKLGMQTRAQSMFGLNGFTCVELVVVVIKEKCWCVKSNLFIKPIKKCLTIRSRQ